MRESRAQLRYRQPLVMLDDRDLRPAPGDANDELSRLLALSREQERERPERLAAAIGLLAFGIVACGAALFAWAVLG